MVLQSHGVRAGFEKGKHNQHLKEDTLEQFTEVL